MSFNTHLLQRIEQLFTERINKKNGWGKNELLVEYKSAQIQALAEHVDYCETAQQELDTFKINLTP